jgi:hypothetical protein
MGKWKLVEQSEYTPTKMSNKHNKFEDSRQLRQTSTPPNKSYKIIGVKINLVQLPRSPQTRHHIRPTASRNPNKETSIPNRTKKGTDQLLKSKNNATHLGIFTDKQLEAIDKRLNKAVRKAITNTKLPN